MKSESSLTLHRQKHNWNLPRPRNVVRTSVKRSWRKTWFGGEEFLNSLFLICLFFAHKRYSRSVIKLRLNHWCHMDCFTDVLATFLSVGNISVALLSTQGQRALGFHQKYLNLCSEDEQRSYGFGITWGRVINLQNFHFLGELSL